ncbi:hypothetical protein DRE_05141 [Drechslerella stenobrocha 248]|uniref:Uncharacterized protein n=1 Tax=Drechslerella stenobrocha 248 TaxID=1043628 RepID=W7HRI4_9PEZI|nr:hypothetical protein DRE_05141 [Drechslerella stenobrocha 248]
MVAPTGARAVSILGGTKGGIKRLKLTTKQVNGGYYKGTGSGAMGRHTKYGGYILDPSKMRNYVVPDGLLDCKLTPFVTKKIEPLKGKFGKAGPMSGTSYLERWKHMNGVN